MKSRFLVLLSLVAPDVASAQEPRDQAAVIRQAASGSEIDILQADNRASLIRIDQRGAENHIEVEQENSMGAVLEIGQSATARNSWVRADQGSDGEMRILQSGTGDVAWVSQWGSEATGNQSVDLQQHNGSNARVGQDGRDLHTSGHQTGVATSDYDGPLINRAFVAQLGFESQVSFDQAGAGNSVTMAQQSHQALNDATSVQKGTDNNLRIFQLGSYTNVTWRQIGDRLSGELDQTNFDNDVSVAQQGTDLSLSIVQQGASSADVVQSGSNSNISLRQTH